MPGPAPVFLLGLDCASPELVFERFRDQLPVLSGLCRDGTWGTLHSVHPPITIPAWTSLVTGCDPGELGLYGFRSRPDRSYARARLNDARHVPAPALWDILGEAGQASIVVGNPQSYPPTPLRGCMVSGLLTPPGAADYTWPTSLAAEIEGWVGDYVFDADAHRGPDREELCAQVHDMTRKRFAVIRRLASTRDWRFLFAHEIGLDRLQHAFWCAFDDSDERDAAVIRDYYRLLDDELGETLELLPSDTVVWVASDHGARSMEGSFCLNDWLRAEGYLVLREPLAPGDPPRELDAAAVDWSRTRAWADGGYCGRIYLNVAGRESQGCLDRAAARHVRDALRVSLEALRGPRGEALGSPVFLPEEVYVQSRGVPPDLLFYPGDLRLRCTASVGNRNLFLEANDTGPDRANHDWQGLFVRCDPERPGRGRVDGASLLDVAPALLERMGLRVPGWMHGGSIA